MIRKIGQKAAMPNPALQPFSVFVGDWKTTGKHPYLPDDTLLGRASFEWLEGGAFLMMHAEIDHPDVPDTVAIFGSDNKTGECFMLTFDERGVSRKYMTSLQDNVWKWWRNTPEFSQRFTATITDGGNTIIGTGEMSNNGAQWEKDLDLIYTRLHEEH